MTTPGLDDAILLALAAHRGQVYPSMPPEPYFLHPLRVMARLHSESETERIAAILHDVVEDTSTTLADLVRMGYGTDVIQAVDCLTHRIGETYEAYIDRLVRNPIARTVKLADLADNLANNRCHQQTAVTRARVRRYARARRRILAAVRTQSAPKTPP